MTRVPRILRHYRSTESNPVYHDIFRTVFLPLFFSSHPVYEVNLTENFLLVFFFNRYNFLISVFDVKIILTHLVLLEEFFFFFSISLL